MMTELSNEELCQVNGGSLYELTEGILYAAGRQARMMCHIATFICFPSISACL